MSVANLWIDVPCPNCGYENDTQLIDIKLQSRIYCLNCKTSIQLMDEDASTHRGISSIDQALDDLLNAFKF